jgi:REP element-mobilizing transposase RayT
MYFHDYKRQSIRKKHFNYQQSSYYFITICTIDRQHLFGEIINKTMILNHIGQIAKKCWLEIPKHFPFIKLDIFTIMPNHIHGILIIDRWSPISTVGANNYSPFTKHGTSNSLGSAIRGFKIGVTKLCRQNNGPYHPFQRNFHDIIIQNKTQLQKISHYIKINPQIWNRDRNNI